MINIANLTRRYGSLVAVDDVSVEIRRGEVVGLLGHNGAGKTTLMKILTGFLEPSSGRLSVGGLDVAEDRIGVQRQIGYLPENAPLYPEMVVGEYLEMMAALRDIPAFEIPSAIARAVEATDLQDRIGSRISTLSKGYRQRVGLAQAIIHQPEVLVLDEPTNGLDPTQIRAIRDLIARLAKSSTIIVSTHILQEVEAVSDRILVMIQGKLVADAALAELISSNTVGLSLVSSDESENQIAQCLESVAGVSTAHCRGADPALADAVGWRLECESESSVVADVIETCRSRGWSIAAIAPERRTLENVFQDLQRQHVEAGAAQEASS